MLDLGQDYIYYLAPICPHFNEGIAMVMFQPFGYQKELKSCFQYLKCLSIPFHNI